MLLVCPTVFLPCCYCVLNVSLVCPCRVVGMSSACPCHVNCVSLACPWRVPDVLLACPPESQRLPVFGGLLQDNDTQRLGLNFQKFLKINQLLYIAARSHTHSHSHTHTLTLSHTLSHSLTAPLSARDHVFLVNLTLETFSPQLVSGERPHPVCHFLLPAGPLWCEWAGPGLVM